MDAGIEYTNIDSGQISQVGYDDALKTLYVRLNTGKLIVYYDVPVSEHVGLLSAEGKEEYYHQKIENYFRNRQVYL